MHSVARDSDHRNHFTLQDSSQGRRWTKDGGPALCGLNFITALLIKLSKAPPGNNCACVLWGILYDFGTFRGELCVTCEIVMPQDAKKMCTKSCACFQDMCQIYCANTTQQDVRFLCNWPSLVPSRPLLGCCVPPEPLELVHLFKSPWQIHVRAANPMLAV